MISSGVYPCEIITRSSDVPSKGADLFYTIRIHTPYGTFDRDEVRPQEYDRASWGDPDLTFMPFDIGYVIGCNVIADANMEHFSLIKAEIPESEICGAQG